jgi:uncharacterized protein YegP (UPF0339 family)
MGAFFIYKDNKGEWRWRFRAENNKIIAVSSESYKNKSDCRHGLDIIKEEGPEASVLELD